LKGGQGEGLSLERKGGGDLVRSTPTQSIKGGNGRNIDRGWGIGGKRPGEKAARRIKGGCRIKSEVSIDNPNQLLKDFGLGKSIQSKTWGPGRRIGKKGKVLT